LTMPIALAVVFVLAIVVLSESRVIRAYPNGGGSYLVARENHGVIAGLVAAAALLIDYVLTVSVSTAAGVAAISSFVPELHDHRVHARDVRASRLRALPHFHRGRASPGRAARSFPRGGNGCPVHPARPPRLRVGIGGANGKRGGRERRAELSPTRNTERRDHARPDGHDLRDDLPRSHLSRDANRDTARPQRDRDCEQHDHARGGRCRHTVLLLRADNDGDHPAARRQHRLHRISAAGLGARERPFHAAALRVRWFAP